MKLSELFEQNGFDLGNLKESFDLIDGISKHVLIFHLLNQKILLDFLNQSHFAQIIQIIS